MQCASSTATSGQAKPRSSAAEAREGEPLGRDVDEGQAPGRELRRAAGAPRPPSRVEARKVAAHAARLERAHLVVHQRDERRDDERRPGRAASRGAGRSRLLPPPVGATSSRRPTASSVSIASRWPGRKRVSRADGARRRGRAHRSSDRVDRFRHRPSGAGHLERHTWSLAPVVAGRQPIRARSGLQSSARRVRRAPRPAAGQPSGGRTPSLTAASSISRSGSRTSVARSSRRAPRRDAPGPPPARRGRRRSRPARARSGPPRTAPRSPGGFRGPPSARRAASSSRPRSARSGRASARPGLTPYGNAESRASASPRVAAWRAGQCSPADEVGLSQHRREPGEHRGVLEFRPLPD